MIDAYTTTVEWLIGKCSAFAAIKLQDESVTTFRETTQIKRRKRERKKKTKDTI